MANIGFPSQERALASLEARLNKENLSLQDIEEIEELIVLEATGKTKESAMRLFCIIEKKKGPLIEEKLQLLEEALSPTSKVRQLIPLISYLHPETVEELLNGIEFDASLSMDPEDREAIEHLLFVLEYPIILDLADFSRQVQRVEESILNNDTLSYMHSLNPVQLAEIRRNR